MISRHAMHLGILALLTTTTAAQRSAAQSADAAHPGNEPHSTRELSTVEEVVVTAQRRSERLQDVPITITVVSADDLAKRGITSTTDLAAVTPGLSFTTLSGGAIVYLRGIGTTNAVVGNESSVPLYVDGVYQPSFKGAQFSFNNIQRVEVLKGPQGTLFGRNATGGAVQIITRDPALDPAFETSVSYENHDTFDVKAYGTTGITDTLAVDLAVLYRNQSEGLGTNLGSGNPNMKDHQLSARSKVRWEPTDETTVTLSGQIYRQDGTLSNNYNILPGAIGFGGTVFSGDVFDSQLTRDQDAHVDQDNASLHVSHDFPAVRLVSITGYSHTSSYYYHDIDQTPLSIINANLPEYQHAFSEELQLLSKEGSRITWIVGAFFYDNESKFPIRLTGAGVAPVTFVQRHTRGTTRSYAAFGQATIPLTDATNLTLGARYTKDKLDYTGSATTDFGTVTVPKQKADSEEPTYRVSIDHKFNENVMAFASFNRGYKSGNFNLINVPSEPATKPEILDAYEIGIKSTLFDRRLSLNASAFYYDYTNLQVLVNRGVIATTENAATAKIKGAELEVTLTPIERLGFTLGVALLDGEFSSYPDAVFYTPRNTAPAFGNTAFVDDAKGNDLPRTPDWTANAALSYELPTVSGVWAITVSDFLNGGFSWHPDNRIKQDSYNLANASLSWTAPAGHFTVQAYVRNLADERYYINVQESSFADYGTPGLPRTYGIGFQYRH